MSRNPLIPAKPAEITFDTLPQLFAHHRAVFGGWSMDAGDGGGSGSGDGGDGGGQGGDQPPERPDDIAEAEWAALGDPGKRAIVRERQRADAAERALAASRARPAPPKSKDKTEDKGGKPDDQSKPNAGEIDVEAIVKQAVEAAIKPFAEREQQRDVQDAAKKVQDAVIEAAKPMLHDATDALVGIDLASVVDDHGQADATKIKTALDDLVKRKPHLAKTTQRVAPAGIGGGGPAGATEAEKVKAALAEMQRANNVRVSSTNSN